MRVSVLVAPHDVRVLERPIPGPGPYDVLVEVTSVGVCGSDAHYYEHGRIGRYVVTEPLVLGHEAGGVVVATGDGVRTLEPGQRVSVEPGVPCHRCRQCLSGRYNLCPHVEFLATPPIDGAFAEYLVMPESFVHRVPDSLSDDAAGLVEPLSVGVWACRRTGVGPGARVLVTGAGPVGLIAAQTARAFGASEITVTDVNAFRLDAARGLGLSAVDTSATDLAAAGVEADVLLECSGNQRATTDAIDRVDRAGRVALVGMGVDDVILPLSRLQEHEITVTGAFRYANTWPTAISLAATGRVDLDALVTGQVGLSGVEEALRAVRENPRSLKTMVHPGMK